MAGAEAKMGSTQGSTQGSMWIGKRWTTVLRVLPLGFLAVVLWREKPWNVRLSETAPWAVAASVLLNFAVLVPLRAARWRIALRNPPPFREALAATIEGLLANAAVGFGGGDLVRAARIKRAERQLAIDYACTWAERGAEALALTILVFGTALLTNLGTWAMVLSGLGAAAYVATLTAGRFLLPRLSRWPRVQSMMAAVLQASTPRRVAAMVAVSLLAWAFELGMLVIFQGAFHLPLSLRTAALTLAGINAAIAIPALPGNFGTFEAGATIALVMSGAPRDVAVTYALTYHLTHVIPMAVVATAVYVVRSFRTERAES